MKKRLTQLYILMVQCINFVKSKLPDKWRKQISSAYILHNIETLPLSAFIDCITGRSLQGLIISGKPSQDILKLKFDSITIDYYDIIGGESNTIYAGLLKRKTRLQSKQTQLYAIIKIYLLNKSPELKKLMSKNGFYFEKDLPDNILIKKYEAFAKGMAIDLEHVEKDIANFLKSNGGDGKPVTRETYISNIISMAKENFIVDINKSTAEYYALTFKAFNQFMEIKAAA